MRLVSILGEVIVAVRRIDVYEFIFISVAAVFLYMHFKYYPVFLTKLVEIPSFTV